LYKGWNVSILIYLFFVKKKIVDCILRFANLMLTEFENKFYNETSMLNWLGVGVF